MPPLWEYRLLGEEHWKWRTDATLMGIRCYLTSCFGISGWELRPAAPDAEAEQVVRHFRGRAGGRPELMREFAQEILSAADHAKKIGNTDAHSRLSWASAELRRQASFRSARIMP